MEVVNIIGPILLIILAFSDVKTAELYVVDQDFDELEYMNLTADPCENFYEYTCGNFEKLYSLQDGDVLIDQFTLLEDRLAEVGHKILDSEIEHSDPIALQKAKGAYRACVDSEFQDTLGMLYPEIEVIRKYGGFPIIGNTHETINELEEKPFGWNEIADIAAEFGIGIFLTPNLYYDTQNASRNVFRLTTDTMEIPVQFRPRPSESYEDAIEEGFVAMANQSNQRSQNRLGATTSAMELLLRKLVVKIKRVLGSDRSDEYIFERVANISNFMKGIYFGGYIPDGTDIGPITNNTNASLVTLGELNQWTVKHFGDTIQLDWIQYVKRLLQYTYVEVDENFLVIQPTNLNKSLYGVLNWVRMNDAEIVKSAALLRAFVYMATDSDLESRQYFEEYLNATGKTVYPRWKYCARKIMDITGTLSSGLAVTYEYQLKYFEKSMLENALLFINNLKSTFKEVINDAVWMDDVSKEAAQTKADNIVTLLGYPEFLTKPDMLDHFYENLELTTWDHFENAKKLRAFQQAHILNMISLRERKAWEKSPFDVNAYYNRQNNRIIFPVAMLNPVFFQGSTRFVNKDYLLHTSGSWHDRLLDYSRIGAIIAHEITHGFDSQGFLYNQDGVISPWWTNETVKNFANKTECFVDQYSNYTIPEINGTMDGTGSLNENLADNGGLRTAFRALQNILPNISSQNVFVSGSQQFSAEQLFFIGYGTMWCNTESISYLKSLEKSCNTTTTCHAQSKMRVNGVVSNMEEFAEAFSCPAGSPMNPENKCRLW